MPVCALTFDFWNTMVVAGENGAARQRQRLEALHATARRHGFVSEDAVTEAYRAATRRHYDVWTARHRTPTTDSFVHFVWDALALTIPPDVHEGVVRTVEDGILHHPPTLADGLIRAVAWAAERFRLGIISDTMFSPGRAIRELLARHGLLDAFEAFVFSDETGFSKPDPRAFEQAAAVLDVPLGDIAHIGDLRRTDVAGARRVGARPILFTGIATDPDGDDPDAVLDDWHRLPDVIHALGMGTVAS